MSQSELLPVSVPSPFTFQNKPVRTHLEGETLWFVAMDVCAALGIVWKKGAGNSGSLSSIPLEWQGIKNFLTPGGRQKLKVILEPAVYKLAFRSNKPEADAFTNWIASEVVPAIRKTGKYEPAPSAPPSPDSPITPDQQCTLQAIVRAKIAPLQSKYPQKLYQEIWGKFKNHFRIAKYNQLPQSRLSEAVEYLVELKPTALKALNCRPIPQLSASESHPSGMFMGFPFTPYELKQLDALADRIEELNGRLHAELGQVYSDILRLLYNYAEGAQVRVFRNLIWARIEEAMVATPSVLKDRMIFSSLNPALMLKMLASGQSCQGE